MILLLAALLVPGDSLAPVPLGSMESLRASHGIATILEADGWSSPLPRPMFEGRTEVRPSPVALYMPLALASAPAEEPQLIEYSDAYLTRLKIHRYASYAMLPLFAAAYVTGNELIKNGENAASWARDTHGTIAGGLAVLFGVNTITGIWNLYDSRNDPEGRTRRYIHSILLLAADAGFVATAAMAGESEGGEGGRERGGGEGDNTAHRAMAITSMSLAFTGYLTMIWPFRRD